MLPGLLFLEPTTIYLKEPGKDVATAQKTGAEVVRKHDSLRLVKEKMEVLTSVMILKLKLPFATF